MKEPEQTKSELEQRLRKIDEEIGNYPVPIADCDAQFNYLLEERAKVCEKLQTLQKQNSDKVKNDLDDHEAGI